MTQATKLDTFTAAYIECALWSSTDDLGDPLDADYTIDDISEVTLARMIADCAKFRQQNAEWIDPEYCHGGDAAITAGQDFWLTRNGHGAGFWDGDWEEPAASKLDEAAQKFGDFDLYIGDDGKIYA